METIGNRSLLEKPGFRSWWARDHANWAADLQERVVAA
jgi:hypothetical protein